MSWRSYGAWLAENGTREEQDRFVLLHQQHLSAALVRALRCGNHHIAMQCLDKVIVPDMKTILRQGMIEWLQEATTSDNPELKTAIVENVLDRLNDFYSKFGHIVATL